MEQSYFRGAGGLEAVKFLMPMASTWQGSGAWQAVVLDPLCVYLTQCQDLNHMLSSLEKLFLEGLPQISPMFPWPYSWEKLWRECLMPVMVSSVLVTKASKEIIQGPGISLLLVESWHPPPLYFQSPELGGAGDSISKSFIRA